MFSGDFKDHMHIRRSVEVEVVNVMWVENDGQQYRMNGMGDERDVERERERAREKGMERVWASVCMCLEGRGSGEDGRKGEVS